MENYDIDNGNLTLNINDDIDGRTWYAIINRHKYRLTFDASGGNVLPDIVYIVSGLNKAYQSQNNYVMVNIPKASRGGYVFLGWYNDYGAKIIEADGKLVDNNVSHYVTNSLWDVSEDITLHALFKAKDELQFEESDDYIISGSDSIIYGLYPGYTSNLLFNHVISSGRLNIVDNNGVILTEDIKLRTGYKLRVSFTTDYIDYGISIKGDVLGTGELSRENAKYIARHVIDKNAITGKEYLLSADYNNDGKIKMDDVIKMLRDKRNQENS